MNLKDKIAVVTGGARGIGREICLSLAKEGAHIALCDVNAEALAETEKEIRDLGRSVFIQTVDVSNYEQVELFVQEVHTTFSRIDILVNNAGITRDGLLIRMTPEDWDMVLNVNLRGAFCFTKAVSKVMIKQREGRIINMASIIGMIGNAGQANYAASKGGMIAFTKSVAKELAGRNVRVNAIAPGFIQTAMTDKLPEEIKAKMLSEIPLGKFGTVQDIANACIFLAGDASSYITGQVLSVNGGMV